MFCQAEKNKQVREAMAREEEIRERIDPDGSRWFKAYFGGGRHFENWLEQCRELGEVQVEEVSAQGYKCYTAEGEKLFRIWVRVPGEKTPG